MPIGELQSEFVKYMRKSKPVVAARDKYVDDKKEKPSKPATATKAPKTRSPKVARVAKAPKAPKAVKAPKARKPAKAAPASTGNPWVDHVAAFRHAHPELKPNSPEIMLRAAETYYAAADTKKNEAAAESAHAAAYLKKRADEDEDRAKKFREEINKPGEAPESKARAGEPEPMKSPWLYHLALFRYEHPELKPNDPQIMARARDSYDDDRRDELMVIYERANRKKKAAKATKASDEESEKSE